MKTGMTLAPFRPPGMIPATIDTVRPFGCYCWCRRNGQQFTSKLLHKDGTRMALSSSRFIGRSSNSSSSGSCSSFALDGRRSLVFHPTMAPSFLPMALSYSTTMPHHPNHPISPPSHQGNENKGNNNNNDNITEEQEPIQVLAYRLLYDDIASMTSFLQQSNKDDDAIWTDVSRVLKWHNQKQQPSFEELERCFIILDRLAQELPDGEYLFASLLDTELLNGLLVQWRRVVMTKDGITERIFLPKLLQQQSSHRPWSSQSHHSWLLPSVMAQRIDKYQRCSLVQPNIKTFNLILDAAGYVTRYYQNFEEGVLFAESMLEKIIQISISPNNGDLRLVDAISFGTVIKAWANCGLQQHQQQQLLPAEHNREKGPQRAHDWYQRMIDLYQQYGWEEFRPNEIIFTTVIHGWAQIGHVQRAEQLLDEQIRNSIIPVDSHSFNVVLTAWSKSNHPKSPQRAEAVLQRMRTYHESGQANCPPDAYSFSIVLNCWAQSEQSHAAQRAEVMLMEMIQLVKSKQSSVQQLNAVPLNTVLHAYARRGNAQRAEQLLLAFLQNQQGIIQPDEISFNCVLAAWSKTKKSHQTREAPHRASRILRAMEDEYQIQPSVVSYSTVLQCYAKCPDRNAAEQAEALLGEMKQRGIRPNLISYNTVLFAWSHAARLGHPHAVPRSLQLLKEMWLSIHDPRVKQQKESMFRAVLYTIAGSKISNKAEYVQSLSSLLRQFEIQLPPKDMKTLHRLSSANTKANTDELLLSSSTTTTTTTTMQPKPT